MENNYCNICGECCKNIAVDFKKRIIFRDGIQSVSEDFLSFLEKKEEKDNVTICKCRYLKDNLCTNTQKPAICKNYPSSPFAFIPDNCGYYGIVFLNREKFWQKLRKMKEEILHYETLMLNCSKDDAKQYQKIINQHNAFLDKYKSYCPDL